MSLQDVFIEELRDLYSAENQLVKSLPKMARAASGSELKDGIKNHLEETKGQVDRLKQIFQILGKKPTGQHCNGMEGVVAEGKEAIESDEEGATKDVQLIGASLRVEHYEIAGYTAAIAIAKTLGQKEIVGLLTETLKEEQATGKLLLSQAKPLLKEAGSEDDADEEEDSDEPEDGEEAESKRKSEEDEAEAQKSEGEEPKVAPAKKTAKSKK
ncbi:YciE/YciF ferroxidase family protein [Granulicella arctica]|uniref:YciE/YciF ferroxidase family protein n=1 Tax=Granulicella arctica TaxID=940613 RepID=UPI0021DFEE25|nr:ferritin-like domain-containing protein [Granulicella arctica]